MKAATAMTALAASVCRENENTMGVKGTGIASRGVALAMPGTNRSSVVMRNTALAAIAPLKPATKEVHPVRKPARPRRPREDRHTPRPPSGASAASSAYAIAPMNASTPPATHASRNQGASGTAAATAGDLKRIPPPMTLATMMAAAS